MSGANDNENPILDETSTEFISNVDSIHKLTREVQTIIEKSTIKLNEVDRNQLAKDIKTNYASILGEKYCMGLQIEPNDDVDTILDKIAKMKMLLHEEIEQINENIKIKEKEKYELCKETEKTTNEIRSLKTIENEFKLEIEHIREHNPYKWVCETMKIIPKITRNRRLICKLIYLICLI